MNAIPVTSFIFKIICSLHLNKIYTPTKVNVHNTTPTTGMITVDIAIIAIHFFFHISTVINKHLFTSNTENQGIQRLFLPSRFSPIRVTRGAFANVSVVFLAEFNYRPIPTVFTRSQRLLGNQHESLFVLNAFVIFFHLTHTPNIHNHCTLWPNFSIFIVHCSCLPDSLLGHLVFFVNQISIHIFPFFFSISVVNIKSITDFQAHDIFLNAS